MRKIVNWWQFPYIANGHLLKFREWGSECLLCGKKWKSLSDICWLDTPCLNSHDRIKQTIYFMLEPHYHIEKEKTIKDREKEVGIKRRIDVAISLPEEKNIAIEVQNSFSFSELLRTKDYLDLGIYPIWILPGDIDRSAKSILSDIISGYNYNFEDWLLFYTWKRKDFYPHFPFEVLSFSRYPNYSETVSKDWDIDILFRAIDRVRKQPFEELLGDFSSINYIIHKRISKVKSVLIEHIDYSPDETIIILIEENPEIIPSLASFAGTNWTMLLGLEDRWEDKYHINLYSSNKLLASKVDWIEKVIGLAWEAQNFI